MGKCIEKNVVSPVQEVRGKLLLKGYSLSRFAEGLGYKPNDIIQVVHRFWGRGCNMPRPGTKAAEIINRINQTIS